MALIDCPECGRQVSDKAAACPGCGVGIATPAQRAADTPATPSLADIQARRAAEQAASPTPPPSKGATEVVRQGGKYEALGALLLIGGIVFALAGGGGVAGAMVAIGFVVFLIGRFK